MFGFLKKKKVEIVLPDKAVLPFKTDVHSHVLPGIDDGSHDLDTSVELVRGLSEMGLKRIIATPHIALGTFPNTEESVSKAHQLLVDRLKVKGIDVELLYAAEHRLDEGFEELFAGHKCLTFPDKSVLIENSFYQAYMGLESLVFRMTVEGYQPILAHPERYGYYFSKREVYEKLQHQGCHFQLNLLSFAGYYGREVREMALWLLERGFVQYLATDIHHPRHLEILRIYLLSKDYAMEKELMSNLFNDEL